MDGGNEMIVSTIGNKIYELKGEKIHLVKARSIWGIIGKAIVIGLKEFWEKL